MVWGFSWLQLGLLLSLAALLAAGLAHQWESGALAEIATGLLVSGLAFLVWGLVRPLIGRSGDGD